MARCSRSFQFVRASCSRDRTCSSSAWMRARYGLSSVRCSFPFGFTLSLLEQDQVDGFDVRLGVVQTVAGLVTAHGAQVVPTVGLLGLEARPGARRPHLDEPPLDQLEAAAIVQ